MYTVFLMYVRAETGVLVVNGFRWRDAEFVDFLMGHTANCAVLVGFGEDCPSPHEEVFPGMRYEFTWADSEEWVASHA